MRSYDRRKYRIEAFLNCLSCRDEGTLDLLIKGSKNNNLPRGLGYFANQRNDFSYVLRKAKGEIDKRTAENR